MHWCIYPLPECKPITGLNVDSQTEFKGKIMLQQPLHVLLQPLGSRAKALPIDHESNEEK